MNQILQTPYNNNTKKTKYIFKTQFYISIFLILIIAVINFVNIYTLYNKEKFSSKILNAYNITKLYYESNKLSTNIDSYNLQDLQIIGIIEIPTLNINYAIFSNCNEELLKISPCRLYGPLPGKNGNLCIAGHNYDNNKFFSKIGSLQKDDEITVYDNSSKKYSYLVSEVYEVIDDDLSPIYYYDKRSKQLTLITCNNLNNNRIIVKAFYY